MNGEPATVTGFGARRGAITQVADPNCVGDYSTSRLNISRLPRIVDRTPKLKTGK